MTKKMPNLKIWWIISLNTMLIYSMTTSATSNNENAEHLENGNCCSYRQKKAINDESMDELKTVAGGVDLTGDQLSEINHEGRPTVERDASPYIVARKGVMTKSISARKGVDNIPTERTATETIETVINGRELTDNKNIIDSSKNETEQLSVPSANTTQLTIQKNTTEINSVNNATIKHVNTMKKKFRPKPTVTSVVGNDDDNSKRIVHGSPTKSPPLGMPTKINYVVPVIIIILILPLFVISLIYLYKNGRDCWEKRHYRRMDFLIDGMYNE